MKRVILTGIVLLLSILFAVIPGRGEAKDAIDELKDCARTEDDQSRAACYEELGSRILGSDSEMSVESGAPEPDAPPEQMSEDIGGDVFEKQSEDYVESSRGLILSCRQAADKKWLFTFENGQVWKQSDGRRYRYKECNYYVTITKDTFGYKMQVDGEKAKVRIRRIR